MSTNSILLTSQSINNMKQTLILFNLLLFTMVSFAQDKQVHFAHGLGGGEASWGSLAAEMEACPNVTTTNYTMPSDKGREEYIEEFESNLGEDSDETAIAIGHSFGGICLRAMDNANTNQFGGYFTVGSPHDGAPLANSFLEGDLEDWISIGSVRNSKFNVALDKIKSIFSLKGNSLPENLEASLLDGGLISSIAKASPFVGDGTTINEIMDGGTVQDLGSANLPAISIQCAIPIIKDEFWTTMDDLAANKIFGSSNSGSVISIANAVEIALFSVTETLDVLATTVILFPNFYSDIKNASRKTRKMYDWWAGIEHSWNELIGAGGKIIGYNEIVEKTWICNCVDGQGIPVPCNDERDEEFLDVDQYAIMCDNNEDCYVTETIKIAIFGEDELNDGIVPLERQELPGALVQEYVEGPTHFGEPSSGGVIEIIGENIDPDRAPHPVFKIKNCLL